MSTFLTANWSHLLNFTYAVEPQILRPHLPPGLELDIFEGKAHLSLVAFDFTNTKLLGFRVPWHVNFPEINLRFYVREKGQIGVVFIREFVPRFWIANVAKWWYNEPYEATKMRSEVYQTHRNQIGKPGLRIVKHWVWKDNQRYEISGSAENISSLPGEDTVDHYFKEHEWGYGISHKGKLLKYQVEHPKWQIYPLIDYKINVDFGDLYGSKWRFLNEKIPNYTLLAKGSAISVFQPTLG